MNPEPKPAAGASISELMTQLSSQTSRLVRDEMRLAQKEFVESAKHAGIGTSVSWARIASSNPSTAEPAGLRSYFGGPSEASADRTVFREIFNVLAIVLIGNPSARCSLRISAQSSTDNNSLLLSARKPRVR